MIFISTIGDDSRLQIVKNERSLDHESAAKDTHLNETGNLTNVFRECSGARDQLIEGIRLYRW